MKNKGQESTVKMPALNGRFYEMAAVAPQKRQCDFGGFAPTQTAVKPPLHKAASTLCEMGDAASSSVFFG